jgi:hypothetical protein
MVFLPSSPYLGSESQHLIRFHGQCMKIFHPANGARACSLQTVGFHTHPSDLEIRLKFFELFHDVELLIAVSFKKHPFAEHEHVDVITLSDGYVCQSYGIVSSLGIIGRDNE